MQNISKDELQKLKKELEQEQEIIEKDAKIIYDGRQYAVRIPAKIAKIMELTVQDKKVLDNIHFRVEVPSKIGEEPKIDITLVKYGSDNKDSESDN